MRAIFGDVLVSFCLLVGLAAQPAIAGSARAAESPRQTAPYIKVNELPSEEAKASPSRPAAPLSPPAARPSPPAGPRLLLQLDPLTASFGFLHLQVEVALHPKLSLMISPHLRLFNGILPKLDGHYLGLGLETVVRYFPGAHAPFGWWIGARGVLAYLHANASAKLGGYTSLFAGYAFLFGRHLVLGLGIGLSYFDYRIDTAKVTGLLPAARTTLGLAF